jgi:hypothetical protein
MAWRLKPHSYSIEWLGKTFAHSSKGVSGEAIQRNLDDVRAALNYAVGKQTAVGAKGAGGRWSCDPRPAT